MLSSYHKLNEQEQKLFIAKIINEMIYNQASYNLMKLLVKYWDQEPMNNAVFFPNHYVKTLNKINNGQSAN